MSALAHVKDLRLTLGRAPLFDGAEFVLQKGERAAFVGANGAGKSTLMRMMAGLTDPDGGEIVYQSGASIAFAPQETSFEGFATLRDYAQSPSVARVGSAAIAPAYAADAALEQFGLDPERAPEGLSGGESRRASLARALAADADILLLDEPTNHLDITAIEQLERTVASQRGACLIISHDRRFLERVSTATLWLRQRRLLKLNRGYESFEEWADAVEEEDARNLARLETQLKAEEHWLRRGVTARRSRNEGRRRKLMSMRAERRDIKELSAAPTAGIIAERGNESARLVIDAKNVSKAYDNRTLIDNLSLRITRGDRVGVVGANGSGKTTLLELLLKRRDPDSGVIRMGENLSLAYVDQRRDILDPNVTLRDALTPAGGDQVIVRGVARHVASYAKEFLFTAEQLRQPVSALSGGERNRLALAIALAKPANLLVLDEPTNDLDLETLDLLQEVIADFDGTVLIVSHDRDFLDRTVTVTLGLDGSGKVDIVAGGYADWEAKRKQPVASRPAAARKDETPVPPPPPPARSTVKLSYKDQRDYEILPARITELEAAIAKGEALLNDPELYAKDPQRFATISAEVANARAEKDAAEQRWLMLAEQVEG